MARKHPVEIPPPSPSSSEEEENPSSEEEQEEEDKVNNTNAGKDDEEDGDETEEEEEEDSDENPSSEEEQEEAEEVEDRMEEDKVNNADASKDDEDDDDETEEEEGSDSDSESESDLLSPSPSAFKLKPVSPPPLSTSENGKAAATPRVRKKVKAEILKIEANGEVGGEKIEANGGLKRKADVDADKNILEKYPLLDASLNEMESGLRGGGALLLRENFGLIGKGLMDELEREWKKLKQDEVKLFSRRNALIAKQAGLFLDRL